MSQEMSITGPVPSASRVSATTKRDFFSDLPNELLDLIFGHLWSGECPAPISKRLQSFSEKTCYGHIDLVTTTRVCGLLELLEGARGDYFAGLIRGLDIALPSDTIGDKSRRRRGDAGNAVEAIIGRLNNLTTLHSFSPEVTILLFAYPVCTHHSAHITTLHLDNLPDYHLPFIFAVFPQVTELRLEVCGASDVPASGRNDRTWDVIRCRELAVLELHLTIISPAAIQFIGSIRARKVELYLGGAQRVVGVFLSQINNDIISLDLTLHQQPTPNTLQPYFEPGLFSRFQQLKELCLDLMDQPLHPEFWSQLLQHNTSLETIEFRSTVRFDPLPLVRILRSQASLPPLKHVVIELWGYVELLVIRRGNISELARLGKLRGIAMKGSMFTCAIEDEWKEKESWTSV